MKIRCIFLCTYWLSGRAGRENIWPEVMAYGPSAARSVRHDPNSVNKHFIIWPPRFSFFPFFFYFFFRVTKFGMLLILTEKSGFIQQQSCFSSLLARAIDKIHARPSYGDFLNSFAMKARAGPYGSYNNTFYFTLCLKYLLTRIKSPHNFVSATVD